MKFRSITSLVPAFFFVFGTLIQFAHSDEKQPAATARFRFLFNAYDGDPKSATSKEFEFQINTIDLRQPSEFLKLGERIRNTKWKLAKFEYKTVLNPKTEELEDVSELTLTNTETQEAVILILNRVTDVAAPTPKK